MPLTTREINNTGDPLYTPDGTLLAAAKIIFALVGSDDRAAAGWDVAAGERIAPEPVSITTDESGEFSVDLWPNDRGNTTTFYLCQVTGFPSMTFRAALASGATAIKWIDFMAQGVALTPVELSALQAHISDAGIHNPATLEQIGSLVNSATGKTTPIDADLVPISDSADANNLKKLTWANLKATLKSYFDTLYRSTTDYVFGTVTDNTTFEADGTLKMNGAATVWDDTNISLTPPAGQSSALPAVVAINGDAYLSCYAFSGTNSTPDQISGSIEIPHSYKEGSNIQFHVHWAPTTANVGNVVWQLRYAWYNHLGTPVGATIQTTTVATTSGVAWQEQTSAFDLVGTGKTMGSRLVFTLFRDPVNAGDTYAFNAATYDMGIHVEKDTLGSRQITTK